MQRKLPGIDIPAATEAKILHAAAFLEFKQHVERLARVGSDLQAYTCWMHGVEVCHSPMSWPRGLTQIFFPPLPKMPCCVDDCQRCTAHFGGFKFPWLGLWNSRGVVLPADVAPNKAWDYYYRHQDPMDLLLVAAYTNFKVASDMVPQELYALQLRCTAGDAGQLGLGNSSTSGADGSGVWAAERSCQPSSAFPSGSQGATLSLGTRRSTRTSGALWLAGGAELRHTSAWDGLR